MGMLKGMVLEKDKIEQCRGIHHMHQPAEAFVAKLQTIHYMAGANFGIIRADNDR